MSAPLEFEDASAGYSARLALLSVTASFGAGRVTGILGANGAGKTTLLRTALGLLTLSAGEVRILGFSRSHWSREALARAVAYLPQGVEPHWPVQALRLVALGRLPHRNALARLEPRDLAAVERALARCDALGLANRRVDHLSAGERARVLLARALATEAPILLADEPAAHLDPAHQLRLMELLRDEAARGAAILVTLHELSLASRFCDDILLLKDGRVLSSGPPDTALRDDYLAAAFGIRPLRASDSVPLPIIPWQRLEGQ